MANCICIPGGTNSDARKLVNNLTDRVEWTCKHGTKWYLVVEVRWTQENPNDPEPDNSIPA